MRRLQQEDLISFQCLAEHWNYNYQQQIPNIIFKYLIDNICSQLKSRREAGWRLAAVVGARQLE